MITSEISATGTQPVVPAGPIQPTPAGDHAFRFHDLLSAMNPLQYLPVVGTIYRAVTGDVIPEALRRIGSLVVSGLLGGPIGLGINIATTIAEKATGIDPERIVAAQLNAVPEVAATPTELPAAPAPVEAAADTTPVQTAAAAARAETPGATPASSTPVQQGWTAEQLAAYGVRSGASGTLQLGDVTGADVLNTLQLARLGKAAAAYAANQTMSPSVADRGG